MRNLRDWMRDLMRRRSRRGPNESESTGKSGQELPSNQLAPLRPTYPDELPLRPAASPANTAISDSTQYAPAILEAEAAPVFEPGKLPDPIAVPFEPASAEKTMVVETQPE